VASEPTTERVVAQRPSMTPGRGLTGAALVVDSLIRSDIRTVFGVPGDTGISLYDAFYHRPDEIQHVLARDERHAAAMADAFARASNTVGAVEVSSGGGVSYVIGGLGEAYAASVPVLVITSDIHSSSRGTGAMTDIDQKALFAGVTKWRAVASSSAEIPALIGESIAAAASGRPGPVAVIIPEEILDEVVNAPSQAATASARLSSVQRRGADEVNVEMAADKLSSAKTPVIIAGSGVHMSEAWEALETFAEHAAIPVATTIQGKGAISDRSPWSLGVVGANGAREYANRYASRSDAVLLVGTRANATDTNSWTGPRRDHPNVISVNVTEYPNVGNFSSAIPLIGDAATVLRQLHDSTKRAEEDDRKRVTDSISAAAANWVNSYLGAERPANGRIEARDVVKIAHRILAGSCSVVADPGTPTPNVASYWEVPEAGRSVVMPRGHGPMGYAIPGAVGIALARPGRPVLSITADGSFAMACGELETVARLNLPIVFIQLTNDSLGWIKMLQHLYLDRRYFGVDPGPIDAPAVATACGVRGVHISDPNHLETELVRFAGDPQPLYLNVDVPTLIESTPPVAPWQAALEGHAERPVY